MASLSGSIVPALTPLVFTLLSDGSSDRVLLPVLDWVLRQHSLRPFQPQWADLRALPQPPRSLEDRIQVALQLYPCDVLFVHRDAEGGSHTARIGEIRARLGDVTGQAAICVVPVRMQETWLLFDEPALRLAADNPNGRVPLDLPPLDRLEEVPDPKALLHDRLRRASGLRSGRLRKWRSGPRVHRLADLIRDYSPLRRLSAFHALEEEVRMLLEQRSWR